MAFISHKKRIIFVEIPRTATTSISHNLLYINNIKNDFKQDKNKSRHLKMSDVKKLDLKYELSEYTVFSVLRNPWRRYASFAQWVLDVLDNKNLKNTIEYEFCSRLKKKYGKNPSTIIRYAIAGGQLQSNFIITDDEVSVSVLLKFENLQKDYTNFCLFNGIENEKLRSINKSRNYDYRDYYDSDLINTVAMHEKKIIDLMGYTYD